MLRYRVGAYSRLATVSGLVFSALLSAALVVTGVLSATGVIPITLWLDPGNALVGSVFLGLTVWIVRSGYRTAYEVDLGRERLIWKAAFRTLEIPFADIRELHRTRLPSRLSVLEVATAGRLLVPRRAGFLDFAVALGRVVPQLDVWA